VSALALALLLLACTASPPSSGSDSASASTDSGGTTGGDGGSVGDSGDGGRPDGGAADGGTAADGGSAGDGGSGSDGGASGDGGTDAGGCTADDSLVPSASLQHLSLDDHRGDRTGDAWFPLVELSGLAADFTGTARVCRDLSDGTSACTARIEVSGADLALPSTLLTSGGRFHVEVDDGAVTRCSASVTATLDSLDYDGAGLQRTEELAWSAPEDLDVPPTLLGVSIHGVDDAGVETMTVVASVSSAEGLQQTALVRFLTGGTDAVQPMADGTGFFLLDQDGILALRLATTGAVLEEWEMIPADQRCPDDGALRRGDPTGAAPAALGTCAMLSHGMIVDEAGASNVVLSKTPIRCPEDLSQYCMVHDISTLSAGELAPLWSYGDHVDEIDGRKLDVDLPYINGVGRDGDVTCATWFSVDFEADQTIPAVICMGVSDDRTVFDLDPTVTHVPHDADPLTLPDGRKVVVIADNTNGDVDGDGHRKPPRIQLYELPVGAAAPDPQLTAIASFDTEIDVADNFRFGSVELRTNSAGQLVTVYVDGSGVHEVGLIDLGTLTYTALARQALSMPGGATDTGVAIGARKHGSYALDTPTRAE